MSSKEKKKGALPKLRFPEFRDAGPWEVRSIEQVTIKVVQGGTPKTSVPEYWNGEIPWITPAEMGDDATHHYTESTLRAISRQGLENSSAELLPANSVIISSRAPIGYVTINKVEMATNQGCKGLIPNKDIYHEFLYFSLLRTKQRLNDLGAGAGFKEISTSALKAFKILVPNILEQQKIADCLSSLDEVIELETKKLKALEDYKKGLMQKLFPREGETTPRLRFPEFRDAGEWEVKRLGEVVDHYGGKSLERYVKKTGKYKFISIGNYLENGKYFDNGQRIDNNHYDYIKDKILKKNDLVMILNDKTSNGNLIGATILIDKDDEYVYNQRSERIVCKRGVSPLFLWFLLNSKRFRKKIYLLSQGATQIYINFSTIKKIKILIPPSLPEQQKIADCLSSIDELIELQTKKLELLKAHKKGLMQQLFPSSDEVQV